MTQAALHNAAAWPEAQAEAFAAGVRVGISRTHESAHLHVMGAAPYVDDVPEWRGTLHIALGLSPLAGGMLLGVDVAQLLAQDGVVDVLLASDILGVNDCGPILHDDPILAPLGEALRHVGQPVFAVAASTRDAARRAAALAKSVIRVGEGKPPVFTPQQAHAQGDYVVPPMHLIRSASAATHGADALPAVRAALAAAPHRLQQQVMLGGQEQFYLEGQISYARMTEDGAMQVLCSTQHPTEMQHLVAHALGVHAHRVQVECRRMGGGFGGKESQSALFACVAAVVASRNGCPAKLRLDRDDDFLITGRRHCFWFDWQVGFDAAGRVLASEIDMVSRAGHSADLSPPVMTRALCHYDNAYWLPEVAAHGHCARTNTQSNTAFRGFGGPQGAFAIEYALDSIARKLGLDALAVRKANFYGVGERHVTPYGQTVRDNVMLDLVEQLERSSGYAARRAVVNAFNRESVVLKRGLALTPLKFGISFNVKHFNQAGALVHVYADGSVLVNHGGTEMGQGLNTKVAQVVAHELGIGFARVRVTATDTSKVANTSATAASTGTDLNGKAAQDAARQIRQRLAALAAERLACDPEALVFANDVVQVRGVCEGPAAAGGQMQANPELNTASLSFEALVALAYAQRVQLWSDGFYATPDLSWDAAKLQGSPFYYFAYGAAVSEVLVDTLTGESRVLRADVLHDVGRSLNPALDVGQVEGAFVQGMGWLTSEELKWQPDTGLLTTHAPSTYKIPTANDCPLDFRVNLYDGENVNDSIHRSKAVGEPPLLLPFSVFFAIRDAISAVAEHRVDPPLQAPATAEAVLSALNAVMSAV